MYDILAVNFLEKISIVGIVYLLILGFIAFRFGIIIPILISIATLLICKFSFNLLAEEGGYYIINTPPDGIPPIMFNPECLIMVPIIVIIFRVVLFYAYKAEE